MKKVYSLIGKMVKVAACLTMISASANAATFTAVLSGNFNSLLTWGGSLPGSLLSVDSIVIPSGITVTLNVNQTFSGSSTLIVNGTLTSGINSSALVMTSGELAGSGTVMADSLVLGLTSGFNFSGAITANAFTSLGVTQTSGASVTVNNRLYVNVGNYNVTGGSLTMANGGTIFMQGGMLMAGGSGTVNLTNHYNLVYSSSSATSGAELSGSGLGNLTLNMSSGSVSLSSDATVNGTLTLIAGNIALNNRSLTFGSNGDFSASGSGSITAGSGANIVINSTGGFHGNLRFAAGGNTINNLTLNMGSGSTVGIASDLNVSGMLVLNSGMINIGAHNLTLGSSATVSGGSSSSYVITDNGGSLMLHITAGSSGTFHVGSTSKYAPAIIAANSASANSTIGISMHDSVFAQGSIGSNLSSSQSVVNATWYVTSTATSGLNLKMQLMWSSNMEVNGFNRSNAYISHYTNNSWDTHTYTAATVQGSMYMMTRDNITSLSPFTVADNNAMLSTGVESVSIATDDLVIYPNPSNNTLYFNTDLQLERISVYDIAGNLVRSVAIDNRNSIPVSDLSHGLYNIHFYGRDFETVRKFVKQ